MCIWHVIDVIPRRLEYKSDKIRRAISCLPAYIFVGDSVKKLGAHKRKRTREREKKTYRLSDMDKCNSRKLLIWAHNSCSLKPYRVCIYIIYIFIIHAFAKPMKIDEMKNCFICCLRKADANAATNTLYYLHAPKSGDSAAQENVPSANILNVRNRRKYLCWPKSLLIWLFAYFSFSVKKTNETHENIVHRYYKVVN